MSGSKQQEQLDIKIIVGLGNPEPKYALNRHNIGFLLVDYLKEDWEYPDFKTKGKGVFSNKAGEQAMLSKPMTYMNLSGSALPALMQLYKISPEQILVIHDESEIPFLDFRLKKGGGAGGHNGLKSIDQTIGNNYWRLRFGVGKCAVRGLSSHVLGNFTSEEQQAIVELLPEFGERLPDLLVTNKPHDWMSKFKNGLKKISSD